MSVNMTNGLWLRDCEPRRKHLLHAICDCADDDGRAFPSINYLVWKTDLPRSTVIQYMQEFRAQGVIEDVGRRSEIENAVERYSDRDTSVVRVNLAKLPTKKPWRKPSPATGLGCASDQTTVVQPPEGVVQRKSGGSPAAGGAIRKNHHEPSLEPSEGETPPDLHPLAYARKIAEELAMPAVSKNLSAIAGAIEVEIKQGKSKAAAYEYVLAKALDARDAEVRIDKFYFEDWAVHRNGVKRPADDREDFRRRHLK